MVATSQPIAARVGRDILKRGGNAVDAAIASAVALTVVEPTSNGIGGDIFAQVWFEGELYGLNASSVAPELMTPQAYADRGYQSVPDIGIETVTVPGAPKGWMELYERFASMSLDELFAPAIELAASGFEITPTVAVLWQKEFDKFTKLHGGSQAYADWSEVFTQNGNVPKVGDSFVLPDHAKTLADIAATNAQSFYSGEIAERIDAYSTQMDGFIRKTDLERYEAEWVTPISTEYRGMQIWQMPPNGQGLVLLMALNLLKEYKFAPDSRESLDTLHKQIEAMKLAYTDGQAHITQIDQMQVSVNDLLSEHYANERRALISDRALNPFQGTPSSGGTVYLATGDADGNMVSMMQSNFYGFGSGVVVPETGIALHNRANDFSLDPNHVNYLQPGKRMFHTIIPGFMSRKVNGEHQAVGPFGVMGAYMQPQGQLQVLMNMLDFGLSPQQALNQPRWQWFGDKRVGIEREFDSRIFEELQALGHDIHWAEDKTVYGRGQIVCRQLDEKHYDERDYNKRDYDKNRYIGGTEPRCDGEVAAFSDE